MQDGERWEPFREGGSKAKRGRSKATARARLRHSSSTPATFYSLWHSASATSFFCHSFSHSSSPEWRWPWCSCWIRRYSISSCYRDRPQRYSTEHNKSHIFLVFVISRTVCYCAFRSLEQLLTNHNKPAVILYSQTFVFIHRVWFFLLGLLCFYIPNPFFWKAFWKLTPVKYSLLFLLFLLGRSRFVLWSLPDNI